MSYRILLFAVIAFLPWIVFSQDSWQKKADKADSLRRAQNYKPSVPLYKDVLHSIGNSNEEQKHTYQIRIGLSYLMLSENEKARSYFASVITSTEKDTVNIFRAHALNNIGLLNDNEGSFLLSINYYKSASRIYQALNNEYMVDLTKMNIGIVMKKQGRYKEGLRNLLESIDGFNKRGNDQQLGEALSVIGEIQDILGDKEKAKSFYFRSIQVRKRINDKYGLASVYNNLGIVYKNNGRLDSAKYYYQNSIGLMEGTSNKNLGSVLHNLAVINKNQGEYGQARKYFKRALKEKYRVGDTAKIVHTLNTLALLDLEDSRPKNCKRYLQKGRKLLVISPNNRMLKENFDAWKEYHKNAGNMDSALYYLEKANLLLRDINHEEYLQEIAFLQESFEANQRVNEIGQLSNENKEKDESLSLAQKMILNRNWIIGGSLVLVLLLLVVLYVRKQRSIKRELKAKLKGIEQEKNRLSAELHDVAGTKLRSLKSRVKTYFQKEANEYNREQLKKIHDDLTNVTQSVIEVSHELKLPDFESSDFSTIIEDVLYDWFEDKEYRYSTHFDNAKLADSLEPLAKAHIYRFILESLTNIERHAKASDVEISIARRGNNLEFIIADNGIGKQKKVAGIGHRNLKERADQIKGKFEFTSSQAGCSSTFLVPLNIKD